VSSYKWLLVCKHMSVTWGAQPMPIVWSIPNLSSFWGQHEFKKYILYELAKPILLDIGIRAKNTVF
jgi:hypothetical protein